MTLDPNPTRSDHFLLFSLLSLFLSRPFGVDKHIAHSFVPSDLDLDLDLSQVSPLRS